jgi:hypothetical protein
MSPTVMHPRRRPASPSVTPSLLDCFQNMSIRKGDTFHVPHKHDQDLWDPLALESKSKTANPSMPTRSTTCPQALEDLLMGSGERRTVDLFLRVDQAIATQSKLALGHVLSDPEVLPAPILDGTRTRTSSRSRSSDSGIGSSIASESGKCATTSEAFLQIPYLSCASPANSSSDTRDPTPTSESMSAISAATEERGLSEYAKEQIHRYIIQPILREPSLKEFHQLVKDVPHRIGNKEIKNLRDLEKTLIFCAPVSSSEYETNCSFTYGVSGVKDYSRTPRKYLHFCERTIRVLHTTVTTLHESDQRAPTDRPYTQGYFFDLVEQVCFGCSDSTMSPARINILLQIRRYATILAATRERQAKGEEADEMDYSPYVQPGLDALTQDDLQGNTPLIELYRDETVSLHGGLSHNGKPAELVRHKDGKVISLATGRVIPREEMGPPATAKRSISDADVEDEEALRSMARRKKNAKPEIHECPQCDKEFKRPCDLTKHIKTHDRPYKCPNDKCKYHEYGWPTEKECERHVNDKHSTVPSLYHCLFKPCPYTSKRESNCKQHMEKAHNWTYVRSKNNGKGKASDVARLPKGSVPASPSSTMLTPMTPIAPSPSIASHSWASSSRHSSMAPPAVPSHFGTPALVQPSPDFVGHFNMNFEFDFNNVDAFPITPALSEDRRSSSTSDSGMLFDNNSTFGGALSPDDFAFDPNFNAFAYDFTSNNATSMNPNDFQMHTHGHPRGGVSLAPQDQQVSPGAQDPTFTPDLYDGMNVDEGYGAVSSAPGEDFTLFGSRQPPASAGEMFPALAEASGSWGNFGGQFDSKQPGPRMPTESSVLHDLFPELNNH